MADEARPAKREINWKLVAIGSIVVLLVVFALVNTHDAKVSWAFGDVRTSMIVVIVVAAAFGFVLGWFVARHRAGRND